MAMTVDQRIRELLGAKDVQIAALQCEVDRLREQLAARDGEAASPRPRALASAETRATGAGLSRDEPRAGVAS